mgnify:CR=1 FL=1
MKQAVIMLDGLTKSYGKHRGIENLTYSVLPGEIFGFIGPNGAGKTTTIRTLMGLLKPTSGNATIFGLDCTQHAAEIAKNVGYLPSENCYYNNLKVKEQLQYTADLYGVNCHDRIEELAERLNLDLSRKIGDLSLGNKKKVGIVSALLPSPKLLILDEPTGVLTPQETTQFFEVLRNLKKEGYGIIIITHRMSEIMAISDKVTILRDGRQVADLVTADTNPEELSAYMIGRELNDDYHIEGSPKKDIMLELKNVSNHHRKHSRHKLENISLTIHKGEILGIAGVEGNGQKELAEVITGIQKAGEGEILLDGQNLAGINIRGRYEAGVSYISEDRLSDSLITGMNISENLVLREYGKPPFANHSIINKAAIRKNAAEKMKQYQVRASGKSGIDTLVKLLSGGNQQKLIIARELNDHAKVIVASQPTRGLDIGATEFVRQQLIDQRNAGKGVMLISADLEEIMALSDRIAVLFGGKIVGILNREEATVQKIGLLMGGISEEEAR